MLHRGIRGRQYASALNELAPVAPQTNGSFGFRIGDCGQSAIRNLKSAIVFAFLFLFTTAEAQEGTHGARQDAGPESAGLYTAPLDAALRTEIEGLLKGRNYSRAEELLASAIEKNPASSQLLTLLGGILFLDGKYLNCAIAMKKSEALTPLDERSRFTLAMSYVLLKRSDWARPELEKLAAGDPQKALYRYWIARLDYDALQYPAAIAGLQKALQLDPGFVRARDNLGLCYEALGKHTEALENYKEAVRLNRQAPRGSPWPPLNLALLLLKSGKLDEAEAYVRESLRYDPAFAQAHCHLGVLLEKQRKPEEAVKELDQAATLDPAYPDPHYALARIYRKRGDLDKADKALATFLKLKSQEGKK